MSRTFRRNRRRHSQRRRKTLRGGEAAVISALNGITAAIEKSPEIKEIVKDLKTDETAADVKETLGELHTTLKNIENIETPAIVKAEEKFERIVKTYPSPYVGNALTIKLNEIDNVLKELKNEMAKIPKTAETKCMLQTTTLELNKLQARSTKIQHLILAQSFLLAALYIAVTKVSYKIFKMSRLANVIYPSIKKIFAIVSKL